MWIFSSSKSKPFLFLQVAPKEIARLLHLHLRATEWLAAFCWQREIMAFKMRPKHHYLFHVACEVGATRVNPRIYHVWEEEKFLGKLKKIATKCHGATVQTRALERYLLVLARYMAG